LLFVAALALGLAVRGPAGPGDIALADDLVRTSPPWIAGAADTLGSLPVFAAISIIALVATFLASRRRWSAAFAMALFVEVPVEILKVVIDRPRPPTANEIEAFGSIASYPSGHVARIAVIAGLLAAILLTRRGRAAWLGVLAAGVVVGLVAFGRIAAGAHWPTDVLGGILVGVGWFLGTLLIARGTSSPPRLGGRGRTGRSSTPG
jgi:undecaprenyl-diphosphatase